MVHYRPVHATGLRLGDNEALMEHSSNTYPYGLVNVASEYTARIPHLFANPTERGRILDLYLIDLPEPHHPAPTVNVVEIGQIGGDSLSTILEESTESTRSHRTNYTYTLIDPYGQEFPAFPLGFGGAIFAVSNDEPPATGRPIKRGSLGRKETLIVGLRESTWRMPKRMRLTQAQVANTIFAVIWPTHSTCVTTSKFSRFRAPTLPSP
jgi:hypothetical protein